MIHSSGACGTSSCSTNDKMCAFMGSSMFSYGAILRAPNPSSDAWVMVKGS